MTELSCVLGLVLVIGLITAVRLAAMRRWREREVKRYAAGKVRASDPERDAWARGGK